jgi:hypothetical protein
MSKVKALKLDNGTGDQVSQMDNGTEVSLPNVPVTPNAPVQERMQDSDRMALELAKSRRETVLAQSKEALAKSETAELTYKYVILQIYLKYHLSTTDAISENGDIIRGGAIQQAPQAPQG